MNPKARYNHKGVVAITDACENGHIACPSCCTKMKRKSRSRRDIYPCPFCDMEIGSKIGSKRNRCRGLEKLSNQSVGFHAKILKCSKLTSEKDYLTVPFEFAGYSALLSLDVRIKKISISYEFDEEVEQVAREALRNDDDDNPLGLLQVVLTDPGTLDCSNCQEPLTTPIYQ
nr:aminotransferase-like mobile domain-containing protein [Tanacetum cinerariifolium]